MAKRLTIPRTSSLFSGEDLRGMCRASVVVLEHNVQAINALNVYPVPDGDTGTNMLLTMRSVCEEMDKAKGPSLAAVAQSMARGALLGARGNSGVISSQFLRGMARCFEGKEAADPGDLAEAFSQAAASAYKAVGKPVEGTMLTVMRRASEAAKRAAGRTGASALAVFQSASRAAAIAVRKTPEQLDVLKQAGVVDAGGQGFALMLQATAYTLQGKDPRTIRLKSGPAARVSEAFLAATEEEQYGNCIQFTLEHLAADSDALREALGRYGNSVVVIGDRDLVKVHLHGEDPERVLAYGRSVGTLDRVKIENIDAQHLGFMDQHRALRPRAALGVVAVANGPGLEEIFREMGAVIVKGGQTMNPSCQQLLDAAEEANAELTVILPNNSNIVPTARQAQELGKSAIQVVPTVSIPQGIAAMLAMNLETATPEANVAAMLAAPSSVRSGEVAVSVRAATVDGVSVPEGAVMGLLDGRLAGTGKTCGEAISPIVQRASAGPGNLVTLYYGSGVSKAEARAEAEALKSQFAGLEVEVVSGGQPYYPYLVSVE